MSVERSRGKKHWTPMEDPWVVVIGIYHFGSFRNEQQAEHFVHLNGGRSYPLWGATERDARTGRPAVMDAVRSVRA